jgi:hypothetical protein
MGATGTNWKTQSRTCERMTAGNACHSPTFFHRKKKSPSHNSKSYIMMDTKNTEYAYHNDYEDNPKYNQSMNTTTHRTKGKFQAASRQTRTVRSSSEAHRSNLNRPYQTAATDACVLYNGAMNISGIFYKVFIEENIELEMVEITYTNHKTGHKEISKKYSPQIWSDILENYCNNFEDLIAGIHSISQKNQFRENQKQDWEQQNCVGSGSNCKIILDNRL